MATIKQMTISLEALAPFPWKELGFESTLIENGKGHVVCSVPKGFLEEDASEVDQIEASRVISSAIIKAMNATYGQGIEPDKIEKLLERAMDFLECYNNGTTGEIEASEKELRYYCLDIKKGR